MFDLEDAITCWRQRLFEARGISTTQGAELERHLRDEIEALRPQLSSEEAFVVAARRLGDLGAIGKEFEAADPVAAWRGNAAWLSAGILVMLAFSNVRGALAQLFMLVLQHRHASAAELVMLPVIAPVIISLAAIALCAVALHHVSPRPWQRVTLGWAPLALITFGVNTYLRSHAFTDLWSPGIATLHEQEVMGAALGWTPAAMFVAQVAVCTYLFAASCRGLRIAARSH